MYKEFLKNYIYITGKKIYESFVCSLKLANFIFGREKFYNNSCFSNIYENKEKITIITCGEKKVLFKKMVDNFSNFSKRNISSDITIGEEHFCYFKKEIKKIKETRVFIFLCVENFNKLFKSKIVSFMDKKYFKRGILIFVGEKKSKSRLFERCLHLDFFQKEKSDILSFLEKKIIKLIEEKKKKNIQEICNRYSSASILKNLEKVLKSKIINSRKKCNKFLEAIEMINYVFYKAFFIERKKMLIFLTELLILLDEK